MNTNNSRVHYCANGRDRNVRVKWDGDAKAYVQQERCAACGSMFELYVG